MITPERLAELKPGDRVNLGGQRGTVIIDRIEPCFSDFPHEPNQMVYFHQEHKVAGSWDRLYLSALAHGSEDLGMQWCGYCGKELPQGQGITATIWRNRGQEISTYCGAECASHAQMSAEG